MKEVIYDSKKNKYLFFLIEDSKKIRLARSNDKIRLYNKLVKCANVLLRIFCLKDAFLLLGILIIKDKYNLTNYKSLNFKVNKRKYKIQPIIHFKVPFIKFHLILYKSKIFYKDFEGANIHNKLFLSYQDKDGYGFLKAIKFNFLLGNKTKDYFGPIKIIKKTNTSIYVRRATNNRMYITVRLYNKTDELKEKVKILFARLLSYLLLYKKVVLMYEKESYKYEESASVLYERLIDLNYKDIYYVIDKNSPHVLNIKDKYKKNIIYKSTFKHYLYFFLARTFIGSETISHAIDLRVANRFIYRKIVSKKYQLVFLQHGITYMISLASDYRKSFRKGESMPENTKIVVSSMLEARHFIEHGNYDMSDLYITGMPKFDRNIKYKNADKIIVMPTWRPWEYNEIRTNFKNTGYYKMLMNIIAGIPENLKEKLIVLPHPLFMEAVKDSDFPLEVPTYKSYDQLLRETDLLITDYSSIAYDAFYRGAKVIFWWQDIDECMQKYGGYLMLNHYNAFGDICYNTEDLRKVIYKNYKRKQKEEYIDRFRQIVEFNDNKNTDRLVELLEKDNIIKK